MVQICTCPFSPISIKPAGDPCVETVLDMLPHRSVTKSLENDNDDDDDDADDDDDENPSKNDNDTK